MSHHGTEFDDHDFFGMNKEIDGLFGFKKDEVSNKLGATGKYPEGKLNEHDEGEITFAMAIDKGKLIMRFGKPLEWIGFSKQNVTDLITYLQEKVKEM